MFEERHLPYYALGLHGQQHLAPHGGLDNFDLPLQHHVGSIAGVTFGEQEGSGRLPDVLDTHRQPLEVVLRKISEEGYGSEPFDDVHAVSRYL
jgi:hypothetical protein